MRSKEDTVYFEQATAPKPGVTNGPLATPHAAFILIGKTGVGKSNFIKLLGGRTGQGEEPTVGEGIDSCTRKTTVYDTIINDKEVILVDTPGFDDSGTENLDILVNIVSILYLFGHQKDHIPIHGVIFLHDISEVRFSGSQRKTLSILRALCGEACMGNVIIGTTKWSPEKPEKLEKEKEREQKLLREHWNGIYKTTRLFENDRNAVVQIVTDLLAKAPVLLRAQEEMLTPPHTVEHTTAGKLVIPEAKLERDQLLRDFAEQQQRFEEDKDRIDAEIRKLKEDREKMFEENSENVEILEQAQKRLEELEEEKKRNEKEEAKTNEKQKEERGFLDNVFDRLKNVPDMTFAEKFGLAIAAPIILAPAALVAAPVGIIAAFVGLSNHFTKPRQQPT